MHPKYGTVVAAGDVKEEVEEGTETWEVQHLIIWLLRTWATDPTGCTSSEIKCTLLRVLSTSLHVYGTLGCIVCMYLERFFVCHVCVYTCTFVI